MEMQQKVRRLIEGVIHPGLPLRLTKLPAANQWGSRHAALWKDAEMELSTRYRLLGKGIPPLTAHLVKRHIELGKKLESVYGKKWDRHVKETYGNIVHMRKWDEYPAAMLPFQILKAEKRLEGLEKGIPELSSKEQYDKALGRIQKENERFRVYGNNLRDYMGQNILPEKASEARGHMAAVDAQLVAAQKKLDELHSRIVRKYRAKAYYAWKGQNYYIEPHSRIVRKYARTGAR